MLIKNLKQTCDFCPSQWEFRTYENRPVYVRYRWGNLKVYIGNPNGKSALIKNRYEIYAKTLGDRFDGHIAWEKIKKKLDKINLKTINKIIGKTEIHRYKMKRDLKYANKMYNMILENAINNISQVKDYVGIAEKNFVKNKTKEEI